MSYINIHKHSSGKAGTFEIENVYRHFEATPTRWFSAGLHPWYIDQHWQSEFNKLENIVTNTSMLAIGECGLDRVCDIDFSLQQEVFAAQIKLGNGIQKPLIIHCVRAFDETLALLHKYNNKVPVIFHGYNKSKELALQLTSKGYYLSFGKALQKTTVQQIFATLPLSNIFLETDDADISIETIYNWAAEARQISVEQLSLQIQQNLQKVFNIAL